MARDYLCDYNTPDEELTNLLFAIMRSNANMCIIPMQDYLGCDDSCRMNKPSTVGENWRWRMTTAAMSSELAEEILGITARYSRI